jgi:hypothetical protein
MESVMKEPTIKLKELKETYDELCKAQNPILQYAWADEISMLRQALFAKDTAIKRACNFLYNKGVQSIK